MSKSNANSSNIIKPALTSTSSPQMRSILNPNAKMNLSQQGNEHSSPLFARLQSTSNALVLQDATGKSATVHLKKVPVSTTTSVSEKTGAPVAQIQYVSSAKSTTAANSVTQTGRPQIVYIKGRNSTNGTIMMRPTVQFLPNFNKSIIKPVNKLTVTKVVPNSNHAQVKILKPTPGSDVANTSKHDSPICIVNTIKTSATSKEHPVIMVSTTTIPTSVSNQKMVFGPNMITLPKLQTSNVSYMNATPQMQSKGPILNFKISDGKINEDSINYRDTANVPTVMDVEGIGRSDEITPLKSIKTEKDISGNYKENDVRNDNPAINEDMDLLKVNSNVASLKTMTSILKRNSVPNTNNKLSESRDNEIKLNPVDQDSCDKNIPSTEILEKCDSKPAALVRQPRMKKQHLQVKKDLQEACIEVLNTNYGNARKKKVCKTISRKSEPSKPLHADPMQNLIWKDGIGTLDNTNMHFKQNEFGLYDLLSELEYDALITGRKDSKYYTPLAKRKEIQNNVRKSTCPDDVYKCLTCSSSGPAIEFISPDFCSTVCADIFKERKRDQSPKQDADLAKMSGKLSVTPSKTKSNDEQSNESEAEDDIKNSLYPWMLSKRGFSWSKYMSYKKTKPAPIKLFKDPFPYHQNSFKIGMKLEAIDPNHESYICVVSVVDVKGFRICLHFDSYPRKYDFWVNADSIDIFPAGWCEKNNHVLQPPKYLTPDTFSWPNYLKQCKSIAAPKILFPHVTSEAVCPHGFRVGMKLEALDRKNSRKMCVATVADILFPQRFLVHFDGWDEMYDYWVDATSPYIHPVGWCEEQNSTLIPPGGYSEENEFIWDEYLKQTNSAAAPARAFKRRSMSGFRAGMKIEAVDVRVPFLVRVATVVDVKDHSLKVSFDGWPPRYSFWIDDDSPDIHPVGWCAKTGHNLEPPLMPEDVESSISLGCGIPGCTGLGNVFVPQKMKHTTEKNCPYALNNLNVKLELGMDRLQMSGADVKSLAPQLPDTGKKLFTTELCEVDQKPALSKISLKNRSSSEIAFEKPQKRHKSATTNCADEVKLEDPCKIYIKSEPCDEAETHDNHMGRYVQGMKICSKKIKTEVLEKTAKPQMVMNVKSTIFNPGCLPAPLTWRNRPLWLKYTQPLSYLIKKTNKKLDPRLWTISDVVQFVNNIPNCSDYAHKFEEQKIDGESFLMLSQKDLITHFGLKIGPAIKIYNGIMVLREQIRR